MTIRSVFVALVFMLSLAGCSSDSPTEPPIQDAWSFPASPKFAVTVFADKTTFAVGQTTDIKIVLYNVASVFGAAAELRLPLDSLEVTNIAANPAFFSAAENPLIVSAVDSASGKFSYGVTLRAGSSAAFTGSAVVCKATVKALKSGPVTIRIVPSMLALVKSDGQPITNFGSIALENLTLTIN